MRWHAFPSCGVALLEGPLFRKSIPTCGQPRAVVDDAILSRAMKTTRQRAGIDKPLSAHTLRHSFAYRSRSAVDCRAGWADVLCLLDQLPD